FTVMLSNPSAGMLLGTNTATTVAITDDDASAGGGGGGRAFGWLTTLFLSGLYLLRRRTLTIGRSRHPAPA
ncbi:MAG: hypothetical protein WBO00_09095, partial [Steroidobacteraceae bacterium]